MPHRPLVRLPVPPGPAGVAAVRAALPGALDGTGPALAPVPVVSATVSSAYVESVLRALRPEDPHRPLEHDDVAVVVATSGSTGDPKGVLLTASALEFTARGPSVSSPAAWLAALPVTSVGGLQVVVRALLAGTPLQALPSLGGAEPFTASAFAAAVDRLAAEADGLPLRTSLVPAQLSRLLADPAATAALRRLDRLLLGGAAAPRALLVAARDAGVAVTTTYGMTETAGGCVYDGVPFPGVDVALDAGEVLLGGPMVARGYRDRAEETARAFAGGRYRTGDLGAWTADGRLAVDGRVDDVVQVRGVNVALGAVERVLLEGPGWTDAAVVAVPDEADGSRLVAYVAGDLSGGEDAALRRVRDRLGTAAVPREVCAVGSLPLLASGKIDRAALRRRS